MCKEGECGEMGVVDNSTHQYYANCAVTITALYTIIEGLE